jgi:hypothetical protein
MGYDRCAQPRIWTRLLQSPGVSGGGRWTFEMFALMKWKIIIATLLLAGVAVLCYQLGYRASERDRIAIDARNACLSILRILDGAKQQWALENNKVAKDIPTWTDLGRYLPKDMHEWTNYWTNCPSRGTYSFRRMDQTPICSLPGHQLPE